MNSNENINRIKFHPWVEEGEKNPLRTSLFDRSVLMDWYANQADFRLRK